MAKKVICHDRYGKLYKVDANKLTFRPSIYGILIKKGKVLLSRQWGGYDFPGGGAELYETVGQTLIREFWEETGFKVKPKKIVYIGSSFYYATDIKKYWNCPLVYFSVKKIGGKLSKAHFDYYEKIHADLAEWIDIKKVNRIEFRNSLGNQASRKIIKDVFKKIT